MDLDTCETKDDLKLPEGEIGEQIKQAFEKDENGILVSYLILWNRSVNALRRLCSVNMQRKHKSSVSEVCVVGQWYALVIGSNPLETLWVVSGFERQWCLW